VLTIEFSPEDRQDFEALAAAHPDYVKQAKARHSIGGGHDLTLMVSLAGLAIPAIKDVLIAYIRAGRYKTMSYKELKVTGHNAKDIEKILASLREAGVKP